MISLTLVIPIFLFLNVLGATEKINPLTQIDLYCSCAQYRKDPLEKPLSYAFGKFKGQCIDSCRFRNANLGNKININAKLPKKLVVSNIKHTDGFYEGTLPLSEFDRVEIGFEEFAFGVAHTFLRFQITAPGKSISLIHQDLKNKKSIRANALIFSAEGVAPHNQNYNLLDGISGNYVLSYRFLTNYEFEHIVKSKKHPVEYQRMNLKPDEVKKLLGYLLEMSSHRKFSDKYELFSQNCATTVIDSIDAITGHKEPETFFPLTRRFFDALSLKAPIGTIQALRSRGLLN